MAQPLAPQTTPYVDTQGIWIGGPNNGQKASGGTIISSSIPTPPTPQTPTPTPPIPGTSLNPAGSGPPVTPTPEDPSTQYLINPPTVTNAPKSEEDVYNQELSESTGEINAATEYYNDLIAQDKTAANQNSERSNALASMMGLSGGGDAAAIANKTDIQNNEQIATDEASRNSALQTIFANVESNAQTLFASQSAAANTDAQTALATKNSIISTAQTQLKSLASLGYSASMLQTGDPQLYADLKSQSNMTDLQMAAYLQVNMPAAWQPTSTPQYTAGPNGMTQVTYVYSQTNPTTGKSTVTQSQPFTLSIPYGAFSAANLQTAADGTKIYYQTNADGTTSVIDAETGQPYVPQVVVPSGSTQQPAQPNLPSSAAASANVYSGFTPTGTINPSYTPSSLISPSGPAQWSDFQLGSTPTADAEAKAALQGLDVTPDSLKTQAWLWIANGGTPSSSGSSMGGGGAVAKQAINSVGAQLQAALGLTASQMQAIGATAEGETTAINNIIPYQTQVTQFEKTAQNDMQTIIQAATGVQVTGSSAINKALQDIQNGLYGSQALTDTQDQIQSLVYEYGKVISGSVGVAGATVSSVDDAQNLLNSYMNSGQFAGAFAAMNADMTNRMNALNSTLTAQQSNLANVIQNYTAANNIQGSGGSSAPASSSPSDWSQVNGKWVYSANG